MWGPGMREGPLPRMDKQLGHQRAPLPGRQAAPQLLDPQSVMLTCLLGGE